MGSALSRTSSSCKGLFCPRATTIPGLSKELISFHQHCTQTASWSECKPRPVRLHTWSPSTPPLLVAASVSLRRSQKDTSRTQISLHAYKPVIAPRADSVIPSFHEAPPGALLCALRGQRHTTDGLFPWGVYLSLSGHTHTHSCKVRHDRRCPLRERYLKGKKKHKSRTEVLA